MKLDTVSLAGDDLAKVDNTFVAVRPDFAKHVSVIFTNGKKSDSRWGDAKEIDWGQTRPRDVHVDEATRRCNATVLIDLYQILASSRPPPSWIAGKRVPNQPVSPGGFRFRVVTTIVHELVHVSQGWQLGKNFFRDLAEERLSATARFQDFSDVNPDMPADPYLQNAFEAGARDFASRWVDQNGDDVHTGKFDFLLPMTTMRGVFPDLAAPYSMSK